MRNVTSPSSYGFEPVSVGSRAIRTAASGLSTLLLAGSLEPGLARAEDADRFRPYLRFHSGDLSPQWGVDDLWSFGLGANFNGWMGGELAVDFFERDLDLAPYGGLGEVSAWNVVPEIRLRRPLLNQRLVPYLVAGIGPSFLQFNDRKASGFDLDIDVEGWTFAIAAGAGLEYFIADNVTFGIEGKYMWVNPIEGRIDGQPIDVDLSSPLFTFGLRIYFDENQPRPFVDLASPAPNRFFFGLRLGGSMRTDERWIPGVNLKPEASAWGGVNQTGALSLGMDFGHHLGVELAVDSLEHGIDVDSLGTVGEYGMGVAIPYLRLRYPIERGRWVPYLMAGLGLAYGEFNDAKASGQGFNIDAKGIHPALGLGGGIEYFVARNFSLNLDTRWLYTWDHEIEISDSLSGRGDFSAFLVSLGFRVYLLEGRAKKD